jgi:hypothetical protein
MIYLIIISALFALGGFFWALRSALLEKVAVENQAIGAGSTLDEKQRDVMLIEMSRALSELSERVKNFEEVSRGSPRLARKATLGTFNLDLVVLDEARKIKTDAFVIAQRRFLQSSSFPRQEFLDNFPVEDQAVKSFNEEISAQVARALSQASTPVH